MRRPSPPPDSAGLWAPTAGTPLLGTKSALLLGIGALVLLFSLMT